MRSSMTAAGDGARHGAGSPSRFLPGTRPRAIAHRGLALEHAENTLGAFRAAVEAGAGLLETDCRASADGTAFCFHDPTLERVAGDPRPVAELTAAELRALPLRGGGTVLPLEELLDAFPELLVNIDVKSADAVAPVARALARARAGRRVCITSFDDATAKAASRAVRATCGVHPVRSPGRAATAAVLAAVAAEAPDRVLGALLKPYGALQIPERHRGVPVLSPRLIAAAHRAGCEVHVWTVDHTADMARLLAMGVDGIVSNRVDLLVELIRGR